MKKLALALFAVGFLAGAAQAQPVSKPLYAIGNINYTKIEDFKEVGAGGRLGFQFTPNFAVETSFDYYGESSVNVLGSNVDLDAQSLSIAGVLRTEVSPGLYVRGSLGIARFRVEATGPGGSASESYNEPVFGIGAEYAINKGMSILGEYRYAKVDGVKANNFNVGLKFGF